MIAVLIASTTILLIGFIAVFIYYRIKIRKLLSYINDIQSVVLYHQSLLKTMTANLDQLNSNNNAFLCYIEKESDDKLIKSLPKPIATA